MINQRIMGTLKPLVQTPTNRARISELLQIRPLTVEEGLHAMRQQHRG